MPISTSTSAIAASIVIETGWLRPPPQPSPAKGGGNTLRAVIDHFPPPRWERVRVGVTSRPMDKDFAECRPWVRLQPSLSCSSPPWRLIDRDGRVLIAQRPPGKAMAGLWEFPGGKVDAGETPEAALVRELAEELGIVTRAASALHLRLAQLRRFPPADAALSLPEVERQAQPARGPGLKWVRAHQLGDYPDAAGRRAARRDAARLSLGGVCRNGGLRLRFPRPSTRRPRLTSLGCDRGF